jgi:hypothetical protein
VSDPGAGSTPRQPFTPRLLASAGILGYLSAVSLSTFVERKDVKEYLRLNVPKPWFQVKAEIKAPPLTTAYGWAGTSLDYLLRFYLQKLNTCAKESGWVAEESLAILERSRVAPSALKRARAIVVKARKLHREYLKEKRVQKPNKGLIRAAIDLAQLDLVKRIGRLELLPVNGAMVKDVSKMLALVRADDFRAKRTCVLNPTFGAASELVGGADGDIFVRRNADRHQGEQEPGTGTRHLQPASRLLLPILHRRRGWLSRKGHDGRSLLRPLRSPSPHSGRFVGRERSPARASSLVQSNGERIGVGKIAASFAVHVN